MSAGFSKITVVGSLAKDPEMRFTPSGQAVCNFSIPVNRKYTTSGGEQVQETTWHRITVWGKQAEICNQYLKKGSIVAIDGRLVPDKTSGGPRVYQKQDGSYASSYEIQAAEVRFLSSPPQAAAAVEQAAPPDEQDVPF